jgi:hypothetical protein
MHAGKEGRRGHSFNGEYVWKKWVSRGNDASEASWDMSLDLGGLGE